MQVAMMKILNQSCGKTKRKISFSSWKCDDNVHVQNTMEMISALVKAISNLSYLYILIRTMVYMEILDYIYIKK